MSPAREPWTLDRLPKTGCCVMHQRASSAGPCTVTDSRASDRDCYLHVGTAAVPEWPAFGPVCYALGVAGKLVDSRSAAVQELQARWRLLRSQRGEVREKSCRSGELERLIVGEESVGKYADVADAVPCLSGSHQHPSAPLAQLTQVTSSSRRHFRLWSTTFVGPLLSVALS